MIDVSPAISGNPLLDISAVVDQPLLDKYGVSPSSLTRISLVNDT